MAETWIIEVHDDGVWRPLQYEGPWSSRKAAIRFARDEVRLDWRVVLVPTVYDPDCPLCQQMRESEQC